MRCYFTEFEFQTPSGAVYWFPLGVKAENQGDARDICTRFKVGLEEAKYTVRSVGGPFLVIEGINSERIGSYRTQRMSGKLAALEVMEYRIRGVEGDPDVPVDEQLRIAIEERPFTLNQSVASAKKHKFLVKLVLPPDYGPPGECLIIQVSSPPVPPGKASPGNA